MSRYNLVITNPRYNYSWNAREKLVKRSCKDLVQTRGCDFQTIASLGASSRGNGCARVTFIGKRSRVRQMCARTFLIWQNPLHIMLSWILVSHSCNLIDFVQIRDCHFQTNASFDGNFSEIVVVLRLCRRALSGVCMFRSHVTFSRLIAHNALVKPRETLV